MPHLPHAHAVSPELLALIDQVAAERFGRADLRGPMLAHAVRRLHEVYTKQRSHMAELAGDAEALCARLRFLLPRDLPKISAPLSELARVGALPARRPLRVLDVGAGLGASTLGVLEAWTGLGDAPTAMRVDAVDVDPHALELARTLCERRAQALGVELTFTCHARQAQSLPAGGDAYDLILLGFALNELAHGDADPGLRYASLLRSLAARLSPDGVLIALEPALRAESRALQQARSHLVASGGAPYVFAPCLHAGPCPLLERERDWCHERLRVPLPEPIADVARRAGLRESDLSYSYLTLCAAPRSLGELSPGHPGALMRVVTAPLPSKGKLELGVCTDGPVRRLRLLDRHARTHGSVLEHAGRGSVLQVSGARPRGDALVLDAAAEVAAL